MSHGGPPDSPAWLPSPGSSSALGQGWLRGQDWENQGRQESRTDRASRTSQTRPPGLSAAGWLVRTERKQVHVFIHLLTDLRRYKGLLRCTQWGAIVSRRFHAPERQGLGLGPGKSLDLSKWTEGKGHHPYICPSIHPLGASGCAQPGAGTSSHSLPHSHQAPVWWA